ncbi:MAG: PKD domain-containing protein [Euryarchaeota archaeon]|nr:PKD domain-containing protein [Euryarchaeota archaeon]
MAALDILMGCAPAREEAALTTVFQGVAGALKPKSLLSVPLSGNENRKMAKKDKSLEDLDAELARLEAELKDLESGKPPPAKPESGKKAKKEKPPKPAKAGPPTATLPKEGPKRDLPKLPKVGLGGLGKLKLPARPGKPGPVTPSEPVQPAAAPEQLELELVREESDAKDLAAPETHLEREAALAATDPSVQWKRDGRVWRREPDATEPRFERRRLDAQGNIVDEGPADGRDFGLEPQRPAGFLSRFADEREAVRAPAPAGKGILSGAKLPPIFARKGTGEAAMSETVPAESPPAHEAAKSPGKPKILFKLPALGKRKSPAPPAPMSSPPSPSGGPPAIGKAPRKKKRRGLGIIVVIVVVALLLAVVVLPAGLGLDPTGVGSRLGLVRGGGGGGAGGFNPFAPAVPVAKIRVESPTVAAGAEVEFDGAGSFDPANSGLQYSWDFGDGSAMATESIATHVYAATGAFTVKLTLKSGKGATATATQPMTVLAAPVASFVVLANNSAISPTNPAFEKITQVTLDATASSSANGAITSYVWRFQDSTTSSGKQVTRTFPTFGASEVELTVVDAAGLQTVSKTRIPISLRDTRTSEVPASQQAPSFSNETFSVLESKTQGFTPVSVRVSLVFNPAVATDNTVITPPGQVNPNNLDLRLLDRDLAVVGTSATDGSPEEVTVANPKAFVLGQWTAEIRRNQGGANPHPYSITIEVVYSVLA